MRHALVTTSMLLALLSSSHAQADSADTAQPTDAARWYGWQTLVADALSLSVMGLGISTGSVELGLTGAASFILAPSIIHVAHENGVATAVSLTLRISGSALLFAGFAIALSNLNFGGDNEDGASDGDGYYTDDGDDDDDGAALLGALGFGALLVAPILDAVMAREPAREKAPSRAWTVQPWLSPQTRGGGLAFAARL